MAHSVDVLNSSLVHLMPKFEELFLVGHPMTEKLYKGGKIETVNLKSYQLEFTVVTNGPGGGTGIRFGSEALAPVRRNSALRGNEQAYRAIYHFNVPGKDLAEASGEHDFAKLIDQYPAMAMADFRDQFARQLARGASSAGSDESGSTFCDGFTTLNGQQTYNPQGTARQGIFQFSSTQTNTVHGLPMKDAVASPTTGWGHQYANISNMAADGLKVVRTQKQLCAQQGLTPEGSGVDLMFADQATYQNIVDLYDAQVIVNDKIANPASAYSGRDSIKFDNADLYWEPAIDLTDTSAFSGDALTGVLYGLNTAYWEWFFIANNSDKATNGNFSASKPIQLPDQDAWQWRITTYCNLYCRSLRHQMLVTGTANN